MRRQVFSGFYFHFELCPSGFALKWAGEGIRYKHGPGPWFDSASSGKEKLRGQFLGLRRRKVYRPMLFHDPTHLDDPVRLKIRFQQHQFIL